MCGKPSATAGEHFDQGAAEAGLQYIQPVALSKTRLLEQSRPCRLGSTVVVARGRSYVLRLWPCWAAGEPRPAEGSVLS